MVFAVGMRPGQQAFVLAKYAAVELDLAEVVVLADDRREEFLTLADDFAGFSHRSARRRPRDPSWRRSPCDTARTPTGRNWPNRSLPASRRGPWSSPARPRLDRASPQAIGVAAVDFRRRRRRRANLHGAPGKQVVYLATAFAPDKGPPRTQAFIQKYRDAFKEEPDVAAALATNRC